VEEGRTVYDNIKKSIAFILPTNGGQAGIIVASILLGSMLPITPVQILWVNMVTAVTLALALAFEPSEGSVMQRPPRDPREHLLTRYLIWRIGFVSLILILGTFGLFALERASGASLQSARTIAVNTLVVFEIFYLFSSRFLIDPALNRKGILGNSYALAAVIAVAFFQMAFTYLPPLQRLFDTVPISAAAWWRIVLAALSVLVLVELEKFVVRASLGARREAASGPRTARSRS
jgi:magnesium-transporting ATPase (P-type)